MQLHLDDIVRRPLGRICAAGLILILAVALACGIGATALADDFDDLEASFQDQAVLVDDQELEQVGLPIKAGGPRDSAERLVRLAPLTALFSAVWQPTLLPNQLASAPLNGAIPRTISPTGPPRAIA